MVRSVREPDQVRKISPRLQESRGASSLPPGLFRKFQSLIYSEAGIWLAAHKEALLTGRLSRRLRQLGIDHMAEYYELVSSPEQRDELVHMIDCITTNETHFFREPRHFEVLEKEIIPRWREQAAAGERSTHIRVWSAGCSTGEEPYSLAMLLRRHFPAQSGWQIEVLGTDISTRVLNRAREGMYPLSKAKEIPRHFLYEFMLRGRGKQEELMKVGPEIEEIVRFARLNLNAGTYSLLGSFDLIFCRNVLIYFDNESKKRVVQGLLRHLPASGFLFVGHSENLNGITAELKSVMPTVYARSCSGTEERRP